MTMLPGATPDPGAHWNGEAGWCSPLINVFWHYTVGRDSRALIRNQGLAPILIWDDVIWQFGPLDAVHYTQCEWNRRGPGYEVESLDGSITPKQIEHLGYATLFALTTFGIPQTFYDGPRLPIGDGYRGVTNHRNLVHNACDQHSDGFDQWVWEAAVAPATPTAPGDSMASFIIAENRPYRTDPAKTLTGAVYTFDMDANTRAWISNPTAMDAAISIRNVVKFFGGWADSTVHGASDNEGLWGKLLDDARDLDAQDDVAAPGGGGGGGATPAQVQAIVSTDGDKTRAKVAEKVPITGTVG